MDARAIVANSKEKPGWLSLGYHPSVLRQQALKALASRGAFEFMCLADNHHGVRIVYLNRGILTSLGILEDAFYNAIINTRTNNHGDYALIGSLVENLDRARLLALGDPLPGSGPWTIYRGVAGHGRARRIRGYSWTDNPDQAAWFATRYSGPDPAVFCTTVHKREILFYSNERKEGEFCVKLPPRHPAERVVDGDALRHHSDRHSEQSQLAREQELESLSQGR